MFFAQRQFDVQCEWGEAGLRQLVADSDAIVMVDVLSFATCVDIAVGNGATVYLYQTSGRMRLPLPTPNRSARSWRRAVGSAP